MGIEIRMLGRFEVAVDGHPIGPEAWKRRSASALVKLLALSPARQLHRERVIDALWPDVPVDVAAPRLHKAAHYARRALGRDDAVVLRADTVYLLPDAHLAVDVADFERLAARAVEHSDTGTAEQALSLYAGDLLPEDPYEPWTEADRDRLRGAHVDLLRQAHRWRELLELDPTDEAAHLAVMRSLAQAGDVRAALRQYERLDRALRHELGLVPGRAAVSLRDELLALDQRPEPPHDDDDLVGRERELAALDELLRRAARGEGRTVLVAGAAGAGKTVLLGRMFTRAREGGWRTGHGSAATVEGAWPYAPVLEALSGLCRDSPALLDGLADEHRTELERALTLQDLPASVDGGHQRLFVAAAELLRLAASGTGALLTIDDVHESDEGSLRLLHYLARACTACRVLLVLAHRTGAGAERLDEVRASLLGRGAATEVLLGPLDEDAIRDLVERHVRGPDDQLLRRISALSEGAPFAVVELARRAAEAPRQLRPLMTVLTERIPRQLREVLARVAVVGAAFDTDEFVALSGLDEGEAYDRLDEALAEGTLRRDVGGYRFRHPQLRDALLEGLPEHRRRALHREAAARLAELDASPARVGHHLLAAGDRAAAAPWLLSAARAEASVGAYRDALALLDAVRTETVGEQAAELHLLRADLLSRLGDRLAAEAYREAVRRTRGEQHRHARAGLARAAIAAGDLDTAAAAIEGVELNGGPADTAVLLARGNLAYFQGDLDQAWTIAKDARRMLATAEDSWEVLDLVALQGLIAHHRGEWFARLHDEMQAVAEVPRLATAVFDANLCVSEYLLYGPTPYAQVLSLARELRRSAERAGAVRAVAFAAALEGEAALLSGDLDLAEAALIEAVNLHSELGARSGEAHSLQRLAEARLARGDRAGARELLARALPLARWSPIAMHLLQRIHGSMITAAEDAESARAVVDVAHASTDDRDDCWFCAVMLAVPATIACAAVGDLDEARAQLAVAERSTKRWQGTAWQAATREARAHLAVAEGDLAAARRLLRDAADLFARAGQPLDAARCRLADLSPPPAPRRRTDDRRAVAADT